MVYFNVALPHFLFALPSLNSPKDPSLCNKFGLGATFCGDKEYLENASELTQVDSVLLGSVDSINKIKHATQKQGDDNTESSNIPLQFSSILSEYFSSSIDDNSLDSSIIIQRNDTRALPNCNSTDKITDMVNVVRIDNATYQLNCAYVDVLLAAGATDVQAVLKAARSLDNYWMTKLESDLARRLGESRMRVHSPNGELSSYEKDLSIQADMKFSTKRLTQVIDELKLRGLTGNDCAVLLIHTPSIAFPPTSSGLLDKQDETSVEQPQTQINLTRDILNRVMNDILEDSLSLRRYDSRKVIRNSPGLMTDRGAKMAKETVDLLCFLGVSGNALARNKTGISTLLLRPPALVFRLIAFLSCDEIGLPLDRIGPLLRRPECLALLDVAAPAHGSNSEPKEEMKAIDDAYRRMQRNLGILKEDIGIKKIAPTILSCPEILLKTESDHFLRIIDILHKEIGLDSQSVSRIVESYPYLLNSEPDKVLRAISFLSRLDISEEALQKIVRAFPSIISLDEDKEMAPVVDYLKEIGVVNLGRFVTRLPPVLGYSVEQELRPKWEFLMKVCDFGYYELVRFPAYFSYPLDRVIMPRYEYLTSRGIPFTIAGIDEVLRYGDADFARLVVGDKDDVQYRNFLRDRKICKVISKT